jgi:putative zinc finger/helix-turn-helix YgiT family protein
MKGVIVMLKDGFIEIVTRDCPICDKVHEVEHRVDLQKMSIKGEEVESLVEYYRCPMNNVDGDDSWESDDMTDSNLLRARDAYRVKHNLLTSDAIKEIRKKYDLTQRELSNLLGLGNVTVSRYETTHIQDEIYDTALRKISILPSYAMEELTKHETLFSAERFKEIHTIIKAFIKDEGLTELKRQEIRQLYIDYDVKCDANGFKLLDISKVADMIAYFANYVSKLYKVKLMKLLWYADAMFFKKYGESMSGLVYTHMPFGALPIGHNEIIYLQSVNVHEEETERGTRYHILPLDTPVNPVFSLEEHDVLSRVAMKFRDYGTIEIVNYMHEEDAYKNTKDGEVIRFSQSYSIVDF